MTTAARPPQYDISLDTLSAPTSLRDYQRADAALVQTIEAQQHALMCGWGTPPQCFSFNSMAGDSANLTLPILLRVPPFCTRFRVALLVAGPIGCTFQVGALDATSINVVATATANASRWREGSANESLGNQDGSLQVLASQSPAWNTVTVTLTRFADDIYAAWDNVFALAFYPILEQAV